MFAFEGLGAPPPAASAEEGSGASALAIPPAAEGGASLRDLASGTNVPFTLVEALLDTVGADAETMIEHLAFIPIEDVQNGLDKAKLDGNPLTGLQRGQLLYFWKAVVKAGTAGQAPPHGRHRPYRGPGR